MTPESLVATRETSLRLKEKGFPQDTLFVWCFDTLAYHPYVVPVGERPDGIVAAPTLAEVLEQLPVSELKIGWCSDGEVIMNGRRDAKRAGQEVSRALHTGVEAAARLLLKVK